MKHWLAKTCLDMSFHFSDEFKENPFMKIHSWRGAKSDWLDVMVAMPWIEQGTPAL